MTNERATEVARARKSRNRNQTWARLQRRPRTTRPDQGSTPDSWKPTQKDVREANKWAEAGKDNPHAVPPSGLDVEECVDNWLDWVRTKIPFVLVWLVLRERGRCAVGKDGKYYTCSHRLVSMELRTHLRGARKSRKASWESKSWRSREGPAAGRCQGQGKADHHSELRPGW